MNRARILNRRTIYGAAILLFLIGFQSCCNRTSKETLERRKAISKAIISQKISYDDNDELLHDLNSKDSIVRKLAARALGALAENEGNILFLGKSSQDKNAPVRAASADALGNYCKFPMQVEPHLILTTQDVNWMVRQAGLRAIGKCCIFSPAVEKSLRRCLRDTHVLVRRATAHALGEIADEMSIELIVMAMKDPDRDIQSSAARALGCIGPKAVVAIKELCELLQDCNDNRVACHCIVALREIGKEDRNVIRCVISQAGLYEKWTDVAIARTLGRIGEDSNEAYKQLREFIASSPETVVRVVAIRALGKIGRKTDLEFLLHAVKDDSGDVREEARKAIGVIRATEGESAK